MSQPPSHMKRLFPAWDLSSHPAHAFPGIGVLSRTSLPAGILPTCGGQNASLPDVHALTPGACRYVTSKGKRDIADVIQVTDIKMGKLFCIIQVKLNVI